MRFIKNLLGGLMVAEGALSLLFPKKYIHLWRSPKLPPTWNSCIQKIEKHENGIRIAAGIETVLGLILLVCGSFKCCCRCCRDKQDCCSEKKTME